MAKRNRNTKPAPAGTEWSSEEPAALSPYGCSADSSNRSNHDRLFPRVR